MILTEEIFSRLPGDVLGGLRRVDSSIADLVDGVERREIQPFVLKLRCL
jgi:hypothetical protein